MLVKEEEITRYYKYTEAAWFQPLLTSNSGNLSFQVSRWNDSGGLRGGDAWHAFYNVSGYDGHYVGNYRDERGSTLYVQMYSSVPIRAYQFRVYIPGINSNSDWGAIGGSRLYGSNNANDWTSLVSTGELGRNATSTIGFTNNTFYNYYRFQIWTKGTTHKDEVDISSFRLFANRKVIVETDSSDYDFERREKSLKMVIRKD